MPRGSFGGVCGLAGRGTGSGGRRGPSLGVCRASLVVGSFVGRLHSPSFRLLSVPSVSPCLLSSPLSSSPSSPSCSRGLRLRPLQPVPLPLGDAGSVPSRGLRSIGLHLNSTNITFRLDTWVGFVVVQGFSVVKGSACSRPGLFSSRGAGPSYDLVQLA